MAGQINLTHAAFGLEFNETVEPAAADVSWHLWVYTPFTVRAASGDELQLDPEGPPNLLGPALMARHQQLTSGYVSPEGVLCLHFGNGLQIEVPPDPQYEAWTLGPDPLEGNSMWIAEFAPQ